MASITLGQALATLDRDHVHAVLDLERHLEEREPPGQFQAIGLRRGDKVVQHAFAVGVPLMYSHRLEDPQCECRHNLETDVRLERGISSNTLRTGKCPLTIKLSTTLSAFAQCQTRINLAGRGMVDGDIPSLIDCMRNNKSLTELSLHGNVIGNHGAKQIAAYLSKDNYYLVDLDLGANKIGDCGATALSDALRDNYTLTELSLDGNPIRLAGLHAIMEVVVRNSFCRVTLPTYRAVNVSTSEAFERPKDLDMQK